MAKEIYREVFTSPFEKETEGEALKILQAIRDAHPEISGWKEIRGFVEETPNGKFRAIREHAKYV